MFDVTWKRGKHAAGDGLAPLVPVVALDNITAYGTRHSDVSTQRVNTSTDTAWLVKHFNAQAVGAKLVAHGERGAFQVVV